MIRFLIKSAIWLSLAFMIMPHFFPADEENTTTQKPVGATSQNEPGQIDQLLSNGKTALELGKLCVNNPSLCENGASFLSSATSGAVERTGGVLEYLSDRFGTKPPNGTPASPEPMAQPTQHTISKIPIPTPRAEALRALDRSTTGAIPSRN
ncbi:hypothetical protein [Brucella pseudogrignonensis]|uniref:DUF5330 domain-containing protein n=1 Tax=Brucella pseudogrignonensis TaxID=419475 RepID=A0ABU1M610_9HYPH|nr:hypothetical protein [Brucella pseudogrignonensis]MDR6431498.1 hypothetical protein [Brucella pseudogrignonensis]